MNLEQYSKEYVSERRMGTWRLENKEKVLALSDEIAEGLFVNFRKGKTILNAYGAIEALSSGDRERLWQKLFPGFSDIFDLVWKQLDPMMVIRRDGGESGNGDRFTWPATEHKRALAKIEWLRKLLIVVGPFPELSLQQAVTINSTLSYGNSEETSGGYEDGTGHFYDSDALAYLCATLLTCAPNHDQTKEVEDALRKLIEGTAAQHSPRPVFTALLCSNRPDLWRLVDDQLLVADRQAGFRSWLLSSRVGTHPGSWLQLLQMIRDHELLRFNEVQRNIQWWSGWPWIWEGNSREECQNLLQFWINCLESPQKREDAFCRSPVEAAFSLWSEAVMDAPKALQRIACPANLSPDQRLAAVNFLGLCPPRERADIVLKYASTDDLRAAAHAVKLLTDPGATFPTSINREGIFHQFLEFYSQIKDKSHDVSSPKPFPTVVLDEQQILEILLERFPDGEEDKIEALLPKMNNDNRLATIRRLNRYNLTKFDRELAEIMHGSDPKEWAAWQLEHQGSQLNAQRRLLIMMVTDPSFEVANKAYEAIKDFSLTEAETAMLKAGLKSKNARKRLLITQCYANQPIATNEALIKELLRSKISAERLAGLEVVRATAGDETKQEAIKSLWQELNFESKSKVEEKAYRLLVEIIDSEDSQKEAPATVENAFGLVDPAKLRQPIQPKDHEVALHTPATQNIISGIEQWLEDNGDEIIPPRYPSDPPEGEKLKEIRYFPYVVERESLEKNIERFPLAESLKKWWQERPAELRDTDGFELFRVQAAMALMGRKVAPEIRKVLGVIEPINQKLKNNTSSIVSWLCYLTRERLKNAPWQNFLVQATESAWVRLPDRHRGHANVWSSQLDRPRQLGELDQDVQQRLWGICRNPDSGDRSPFHFYLVQTAQAYLDGVVTEDEFIWRLVGKREMDNEYSIGRAFNDLASATAMNTRYRQAINDPAVVQVVQKVCDRIFDLEMKRGESPEQCSYAARAISALRGIDYLIRILSSLDQKLFRKNKSYESRKDYSRPTVLIHLLSICSPAEEDTEIAFTEAVTKATIDHDLLLQLAMFRPAWARFVAHSLKFPELPDAVAWIFAHTRGRDYQWRANAKEIWTGEVGYRSPIPAEEFIDGAVDCEWFFQAYEAIGPKVWSKLYDSAKFASTGKGHIRARMFADALLGNLSVDELSQKIESKGDLNAILAIGLPQLPNPKKTREKETLRRYEILQGMLARSKQSKPQRRASEQRAVELSIQNLARRAGFADTLRFEWAMEILAAEYLKSGALQAECDGLNCMVYIEPDAALKLTVMRDGKPLKSIPAKLKKNPRIIELLERMKSLQKQANRLRPALEDLMARGVGMTSDEWQKLLEHPLAAPLLKRLVFVSPDILGLPTLNGLVGCDDQLTPWPSKSVVLRIAHPLDFLPAETWAQWQHKIFSDKIVQPFKQIFRELYVPTESETTKNNGEIKRYQGHLIKPGQSLAMLGQRGWIYEPGERLFRKIRNLNLIATIHFTDHFYTPNELEVTGIGTVEFEDKEGNQIAISKVPPLVFSEIMRDVDLIVSVAHATGADPESSPASIQSRAALIRETASLLNLKQITVDNNYCRVPGKFGDYRIHLGSGIVHRQSGEMLPIRNEFEPERGRLFLPFADNDPITAGILSRILLFANDDKIRDPYLAQLIRR